jgi:hypothetical protein
VSRKIVTVEEIIRMDDLFSEGNAIESINAAIQRLEHLKLSLEKGSKATYKINAWEDGVPWASFYYDRLETDQEYEDRLAHEEASKQMKLKLKIEREKYEREQYLRLHKKYGDNP